MSPVYRRRLSAKKEQAGQAGAISLLAVDLERRAGTLAAEDRPLADLDDGTIVTLHGATIDEGGRRSGPSPTRASA
ncbi:MAG: hypothetical protein KGJ98_12820 [Chloroflexota bacterium]|nr:hypothetical protein [Chloroflexota bacterium]MDE3103104.1 hypothetical protein [Chloroflexota bacterium]